MSVRADSYYSKNDIEDEEERKIIIRDGERRKIIMPSPSNRDGDERWIVEDQKIMPSPTNIVVKDQKLMLSRQEKSPFLFVFIILILAGIGYFVYQKYNKE